MSKRSLPTACAVPAFLAFALLSPAPAGAQGPGPVRPTVYSFVLDLAGTPVGEIPTAIRQTKGMMEVVIKDGQPMLKASVSSEFVITLPQALPADFTLEFELVPKACCNPQDLSFEGTPTINQGAGSAHVLWDSDGYLAIIGGGGNNYEAPMPEDLRATLPGVLTSVVAVVQGPTIRLYTNGRRHYTLDKQFARGRVLRVFLGVDPSRQDPVYLAGLRIAPGIRPPTGIAAIPVPPPGVAQPAAPSTPQPMVPPPGQPTPPGPTPPQPLVPPPPQPTSPAPTPPQPLVPAPPQPAQPPAAPSPSSPAPAAMTVSVVMGPAGPVVSWTALPNATGYRVGRSKLDDANCCNTSSGRTWATTSPWQDQPLPMAGSYVYQVFAQTPTGTIGAQTQFDYTPPGAPVTAVLVTPTTGSITPMPAPAPSPPPPPSPAPATATAPTTIASASQLGRAPSGTPTVMNDGPKPLSYGVDRIDPGARFKWLQPATAVSFSVCREIAPGNCVSLTPTPVPLQAGADGYFVDQDVVPGSTNTYQLTTTRADGHYGTLGFLATAGQWPAPGNFRILQDLSAQGELVLGWDPVSYLKQDNTPAVLSTYLVTGTGFSTAQRVTSNQVRVRLASGANTWQVAPAYPSSTGGIHTSATPATLTYDFGRYRLIALGVRALKQTADDALDLDGRADEIYVAAVSHVTTRSFGGTNVASIRSATYGDVGTSNAFPGRVQAGTAGPQGGIRSGDLVPISLSLTAPSGTPNTAGFPLLLWEGALDANAMVVVFPMIWEDDNNKGPYAGWVSDLQKLIADGYGGAFLAEIAALRDTDALGPWLFSRGWYRCSDPLSGNVVNTQVCTHAGRDRPIGLRRVTQTSTDEILNHRIVVLTRSAIEKALAGPSPSVGAAPGVIVVPLNDTGPVSAAMYELYLQVERMP